MNNKMNEDRRRTNLEKKLQFLEKEIDRQEKARGGVEQLAKVYQEQPDFVDEKGADDVTRELAEVCVCLYVTMSIPLWSVCVCVCDRGERYYIYIHI